MGANVTENYDFRILLVIVFTLLIGLRPRQTRGFGIEAEGILDIKTPESNFNKTLVHVEGAFQPNGKNRTCFY